MPFPSATIPGRGLYFLCSHLPKVGGIFPRMISRSTAILFALAATISTLHADWKYSANRYDLRVATTTGEGTSPDGPIKAKFIVQYSPAKDGTMTIQFVVEGAGKLKDFGYDSFEGPDAAAADAKLTRFTIERPGAKPVNLLTKVGGWHLGKAFIFAASEANTQPGEILKAVRAIQAGATKISVNVQDSKTAKKQLHAEFATAGAADALAKLLK